MAQLCRTLGCQGKGYPLAKLTGCQSSANTGRLGWLLVQNWPHQFHPFPSMLFLPHLHSQDLRCITNLHPIRGENCGFSEPKKAVTFLFNVRGYFIAGKIYKLFPRSGDADSIKADKRFEVMLFRGEPLLFGWFVFTQRAFLICSSVSCFQIYLPLPSSSFPASLVLIFRAISKYITSGISSLGFMFGV